MKRRSIERAISSPKIPRAGEWKKGKDTRNTVGHLAGRIYRISVAIYRISAGASDE